MSMTIAMTLNDVRRRGSAVLLAELGPVGFVRYLQQFTAGRGDYTLEHQRLADTLTLDQVWSLVENCRPSDDEQQPSGSDTQ